jgi:hypothetical protein
MQLFTWRGFYQISDGTEAPHVGASRHAASARSSHVPLRSLSLLCFFTADIDPDTTTAFAFLLALARRLHPLRFPREPPFPAQPVLMVLSRHMACLNLCLFRHGSPLTYLHF